MLTKQERKAANAVWDTNQIMTSEAEYLREEDPGLTEEQAWELVASDPDLISRSWEDTSEYLTELFTKANPGGHWRVNGQRFGWRNIPISGTFDFTSGQEFRNRVLPNTPCTFYIWVHEDHIFVQNYHHDSPTGEQYYMYPVKICDWCQSYLEPGQQVGKSGECIDCKIATDTEG